MNTLLTITAVAIVAAVWLGITSIVRWHRGRQVDDLRQLMEEQTKLHARSIYNRVDIEMTGEASCFFCLRTFPASAVTDWTDDGQTALCPHCDIDAVLPGRYPANTLVAMCERWFTTKVRPLTSP